MNCVIQVGGRLFSFLSIVSVAVQIKSYKR